MSDTSALPTQPLRIALCQAPPRRSNDESFAVLRAVLAAHRRSDESADAVQLVVFSELFVQCYAAVACAETANVERLREVSMTAAALVATVGPLCRDASVGVVLGYAERADSGQRGADSSTEKVAATAVYNSVIAISAAGELLCNTRKAHLWGSVEASLFTPAEAPSRPFRLPGTDWCVALTCCFDIEFVEYIRALRLRGCHLLLNPSALISSGRYVVDNVVPTRAVENLMFVCYMNDIGSLLGVAADFCGASTVAGPDGRVVCKCADLNEEGVDATKLGVQVKTCVLDFRSYAGFIERNPYIKARRPEFYQ